jgi:hypothetical protein
MLEIEGASLSFPNDLTNHPINSIYDVYSLQMSLAVVQEQKTSVNTLVSLHAQRISTAAEKALSLAEMQLKEAKETIVDSSLKSQLEQAKNKQKLD